MKKFWYRDDIGLIKFRPTRFTASSRQPPLQGCFSVSKEDNLVKLPINLILILYNWDVDSPEANYFPHRKWLRFLFAYSIYMSEVDQDLQAYSLII